jgi:hypothetical protein
MAITDNSFDTQELETAITANPALIDHIKAVLPKSNLVITPKEEWDKLEDTHIGKFTGKFATDMEATVKTLSGLEKEPNEKYTDYYQRAIKTFKEKSDTLESEIKPYREKSTLTDAEKERMRLLVDENKTLKKSLEDLPVKHAAELTKIQVKTNVVNEVAGFKSMFNTLIPSSVSSMAHDAVINDLATMGMIEPTANKIIYIDPVTKKAIMDGTNYATAEFIYKDRMKDFFDKDKIQTGAGGSGSDSIVTLEGIPTDVKSQVDLSNWLTKSGKIPGSKEYNEIFDKFKDKLPLR